MRLFVALITFCASLLVATYGSAEVEPAIPGKLTGQFVSSMGGGVAYFYNLATGPAPHLERYWRVPDRTAPLDAAGIFTIQLAPGDYYVAGLKRQVSQVGPIQIGPPLEGDIFVPALDGSGKLRIISITSNNEIDMGVIKILKPSTGTPAGNLTAIEGTISDINGKPIEGALVLAFTSPTIVGKPKFVSDRSDRDGKFLLRVDVGGSYYLKLRSSYGGGPPQSGSVLDGNKSEPLKSVIVKTGEITRGIAITGKTFPGRGRKDTEQ